MADAEELPDHVKTFIVQQLACYRTPSQIETAVKEEFTLTVSRQRVHAYDPEKVAGKDLAKRWRELFTKTREEFLDAKAKIGIAQPAFRLRMYERIAISAEARGNAAMALAACEQAARDCGGGFTNKFEHQHGAKDGVPLIATVVLSGRPASAPAKPASTVPGKPVPTNTKGARDGRKH